MSKKELKKAEKVMGLELPGKWMQSSEIHPMEQAGNPETEHESLQAEKVKWHRGGDTETPEQLPASAPDPPASLKREQSKYITK